jgi:hypothetical protein
MSQSANGEFGAGRPRRRAARGSAAVAAGSLAIGALMCAAFWAGGQPVAGAVALFVNVAWAIGTFVFAGRSETVGVLAGRPVDERWAFVSVEAAAAAGAVALLTAIIGFVWEVSQRQSGYEFLAVATVGGLAYIAAVIWYRR